MTAASKHDANVAALGRDTVQAAIADLLARYTPPAGSRPTFVQSWQRDRLAALRRRLRQLEP